MKRLIASAVLVPAALLAAPVYAHPAANAAASAGSLVYVKGGDVWVARPDGSGKRRVTRDGRRLRYDHPSQADNGTIVALRGTYMHRFTRSGRRLGKSRRVSAGLAALAGSAPRSRRAAGGFARRPPGCALQDTAPGHVRPGRGAQRNEHPVGYGRVPERIHRQAPARISTRPATTTRTRRGSATPAACSPRTTRTPHGVRRHLRWLPLGLVADEHGSEADPFGRQVLDDGELGRAATDWPWSAAPTSRETRRARRSRSTALPPWRRSRCRSARSIRPAAAPSRVHRGRQTARASHGATAPASGRHGSIRRAATAGRRLGWWSAAAGCRTGDRAAHEVARKDEGLVVALDRGSSNLLGA